MTMTHHHPSRETAHTEGAPQPGAAPDGVGDTSAAGASATTEHVDRRVEIDAAGGPLAVGVVDLETGVCTFRNDEQQLASMDRAFVLLRSDGWPVGTEVLPMLDGRLLDGIVKELATEMPAPAVRGAATGESMSVVLCTRNRPEKLAAALPGFIELLEDHIELIVVDNAPRDSRTADVVSEYGERVRYVVEPTPGLSRARNCGLAAATGKFVTFTDDDVIPDPAFLRVVDATFAANDGAVCVSGTVLPASLLTLAERRFQEFGGYQRNFVETRLHLAMDPPPSKLFPFHPRLVGTGANMSFRAEALRSIGGFDVALGSGTPSRGGEDIDVGVRLLLAGHLVVRQPAAVVWHHSHAGDAELKAQIEDYGCGLAAVFTKFAMQRSTAPMLLRRAPLGLSTLFRSDSVKNETRSATYPKSLRNAELRGIRSGPGAYRRSARRARRLAADG